MSAFIALIKRDLSLALKSGGVGLGIIFYLCLVILFPFGIGPNMKTLSLVSPAIIWAGPLLSIVLGIDKIFQPDIDDGSFDLYRLSPLSLEMVVLAKAIAFWIAYAMPLILISPLFAMMLGMESQMIIGCIVSLFIGSPALIFIGTLCAALTTRLRRAGLLITVLAIPLLIPTLIFGVSSARGFNATASQSHMPLLLLAALSIFFALICCFSATRILQVK